jgi:hypothetical protein
MSHGPWGLGSPARLKVDIPDEAVLRDCLHRYVIGRAGNPGGTAEMYLHPDDIQEYARRAVVAEGILAALDGGEA